MSDPYFVRDEFLETRDKIIGELMYSYPEDYTEMLAFSEELNKLQRFDSPHEEIIYLQTQSAIFGFSGLLKQSNILSTRVEKIIEELTLDLDELDPFSMGSYCLGRGITTFFQKLDWSHDIHESIEFTDRAYHYFERAGAHDRMLMCLRNLGEMYFTEGQIKKSMEKLQQGLDLIQSSTQLPPHRVEGLHIRFGIWLLQGEFYLLDRETVKSHAAALTQRVLAGKYWKSVRLMSALIILFDILVDLEKQDEAVKLIHILIESIVEHNKELKAANLPYNQRTMEDKFLLELYMIAVLNIHEHDLGKKHQAYKDFNKIIDKKVLEEHDVRPGFLIPRILIHQLYYLFSWYRGFQEDTVLDMILSKVEELKEFGRTYGRGLDFLNGILLHSRLLLLTKDKDAARQLLVTSRTKFEQAKLDDLVEKINWELEKIDEIRLETDRQDRIHQLNIQAYIRKAQEIFKEMET